MTVKEEKSQYVSGELWRQIWVQVNGEPLTDVSPDDEDCEDDSRSIVV